MMWATIPGYKPVPAKCTGRGRWSSGLSGHEHRQCRVAHLWHTQSSYVIQLLGSRGMEADRGSGGPARVQPTMRPSGPPFLVWEYWRNWVRQRERIWAWKGVCTKPLRGR
jgi:hypothetical protein